MTCEICLSDTTLLHWHFVKPLCILGPMRKSSHPDFTQPDFLNEHVQSILAFYQPNVRAPDGGFHQCFLDDGSVYDSTTRHLVSSTRFVFNYATAARLSNNSRHLKWAIDGMQFLKTAHRQPLGHYAWELNGLELSDGRALLDESLLILDSYRGQNANMHTCEALLLAYKATGELRYLDRAEVLAHRFAIEIASLNNGLIWEHYDEDWQCDMQYNINKPDDLFKPWGFQPGHQIEWSKLLMELNEHRPSKIWVDRAIELFDVAMTKGWDHDFGGLVYGFGPDGKFADTHKYFWVHAEAFAAAWRLYRHTQNATYLQAYNQLWAYSWDTLVDHDQGSWFRIRNRDGSAFDNLKSPPGKTDYHTMGACWDVLANQ